MSARFAGSRRARRKGLPGGRGHGDAKSVKGAEEAGGQRSDLGARVLVALPAIAFALFIVIEGGAVFTAGLFLLGVICLHELFAMYKRTKPVPLAGFAGLAGLLLAAQYGGRSEVLLAAVAVLPLLFLLGLLQRAPSAAGMMVTLFGLWWVGFGLAHAVLLRGLPHGLGVVLDVLVGTFFGDTGAYLGGRLFGKRPLAPSISPNKTIEGLLIGMVVAIVGVWLAARYQPWMPVSHSLVLGLGVAVCGPVGDLFESFIKRQAGTKDTGSAFGAHGGALDRLDAVLFTAVVGYYIWAAYV
ncbi:MAG TPA: phosphatidate cytidylyltransferase [Solirubrobacteraceae bacterium]|jgi:phosphatidate cytidylyltransferase